MRLKNIFLVAILLIAGESTSKTKITIKNINSICDNISFEDENKSVEKVKILSLSNLDDSDDCYDYLFTSGEISLYGPNGILWTTSENTSLTISPDVPSSFNSSIINLSGAKSSFNSTDNRIVINASLYDNYPYSAICQVASQLTNGLFNFGTGVLINDNIVLTAAHIITNNYSILSPKIAFALPNGGGYSSTYYPTDVIIPKKYIDVHNDDYDWAILRFDEMLSSTRGYLGIKTNEKIINSNKIVTSIGFSGEYEESLYISNSKGCKSENDRMYELYSYGEKGMSGGPVIEYINNKPFVIGINSQKKYYSEWSWSSFRTVKGLTTKSLKVKNSMLTVVRIMEDYY